MLNEVLSRALPTAVCTVYDSVPDWPPLAMTALSLKGRMLRMLYMNTTL